jgi:glutaminase
VRLPAAIWADRLCDIIQPDEIKREKRGVMTSTEQLHQQMIFNLVARVEATEKLACAAIAILCELRGTAPLDVQQSLDQLFKQFAEQQATQQQTPVQIANWLRNREQEHLAMDRLKIDAQIAAFSFFPKAARTTQ